MDLPVPSFASLLAPKSVNSVVDGFLFVVENIFCIFHTGYFDYTVVGLSQLCSKFYQLFFPEFPKNFLWLFFFNLGYYSIVVLI